MADRKETPDVLGEILGGTAPTSPQPSATSGTEKVAPPPQSPSPKPKLRKRRRSPEKLPKWEYMEVVFRDYRGWRPRCINGIELLDWRSQAIIHDYLNHLGGEGWEMVDIEKRRWYEKVAYFKRQVR